MGMSNSSGGGGNKATKGASSWNGANGTAYGNAGSLQPMMQAEINSQNAGQPSAQQGPYGAPQRTTNGWQDPNR